MRLIRLLAAVLAGAVTLVLPRRRPGRLRLDRARAVLRLAARGGARYAASAPRLFAAAGEQRQLLREDLALQTAEDVADTLGAMKGVMMKIGQMASYVDDGLSPAVRHTLARLQDSVPPMSPRLAAAVGLLGRAPLLRPAQPGRAVHRCPAALRDPAAHQPRAIRGARRAVRHRRLARHRRGNLALRPRPGVHPDRTSRGRMAGPAPGGSGRDAWTGAPPA